jgi:hypothetical protein
MSYLQGCYTWYGREVNILHMVSWSLAMADGKRISTLDYLIKVHPQPLPQFEQVLAGALACLLNSLFKFVWSNLLLDKCTCQWDSRVPNGPVSEGKTGKCGDESDPKELGTPFPM